VKEWSVDGLAGPEEAGVISDITTELREVISGHAAA
jgi:hypothetical protein